MRCSLVRCRAVLVERIDRLGRVSFTCPGCARRKAGLCQRCPRPVDGKRGIAYYCTPCRKAKQKESVMRWQQNNLDVIAAGMRRRRWQAKGLQMPATPMTRSQAGKIGGRKGALARLASLGPERVKEIAAKARAARWAKYRAQRSLSSEADHV